MLIELFRYIILTGLEAGVPPALLCEVWYFATWLGLDLGMFG